MKVVCKSVHPSAEQIAKLSGRFYRNQSLPITIGKEYLVFAFQVWSGCPWVQVIADTGHLLSIPVVLFDISDGRVSRHWVLRVWDNCDVTEWPADFYEDFFHDDLAEGVSETVNRFHELRVILEAEFDNQ